MTDVGDVRISARITVEKVDVSGRHPRHVETVVLEGGRVVSRSTSSEGE